jgi:hypothetical protein
MLMGLYELLLDSAAYARAQTGCPGELRCYYAFPGATERRLAKMVCQSGKRRMLGVSMQARAWRHSRNVLRRMRHSESDVGSCDEYRRAEIEEVAASGQNGATTRESNGG